MSTGGKGSGRRAGANDKAFLANCPFPSLLEKRKMREAEEKAKQNQKPKGVEAYPKRRGTNHLKEELESYNKGD